MYVLTNGSRVRFFSFLGADIVLGIAGPKNDPHIGKSAGEASLRGQQVPCHDLHHREPPTDDAFRLKWGEHSKYYLSWMGNGLALALHDALGHRPGQDPADSLFAVDPVKDGTWFALQQPQAPGRAGHQPVRHEGKQCGDPVSLERGRQSGLADRRSRRNAAQSKIGSASDQS